MHQHNRDTNRLKQTHTKHSRNPLLPGRLIAKEGNEIRDKILVQL
jgi:hypothetical protein